MSGAESLVFVKLLSSSYSPTSSPSSVLSSRAACPWKTLKGTAEEGDAAHSTENAVAAEATPSSAAGPQATDVGVAASTTDGNSSPVPLRSVPARAPRVYLGGSNLHVGQIVELTREQTRYLVGVMRLRDGSSVRVFDGVNGEFLASVSSSNGRGGMNRARRSGLSTDQSVDLRVDFLVRTQPESSTCRAKGIEAQDVAVPDVELIFAPIRKQRLKVMVEKTVELGVSRLTPVLTARTQKGTVSDPKALGKLGLVTAVEAAEQCERMTVPNVGEAPVPLLSFLQDVELQRSCRKRGSDRDAEGVQKSDGCFLPEAIFVCKERDTDAKPVLDALAEYARDRQEDISSSGVGRSCETTPQYGGAAFLVGPEGGFDPDEMRAMAEYPFVCFVSLGPLVLRAETAAMYALSSWSAFWAARDRSVCD